MGNVSKEVITFMQHCNSFWIISEFESFRNIGSAFSIKKKIFDWNLFGNTLWLEIDVAHQLLLSTSCLSGAMSVIFAILGTYVSVLLWKGCAFLFVHRTFEFLHSEETRSNVFHYIPWRCVFMHCIWLSYSISGLCRM